eukprot:700855_1
MLIYAQQNVMDSMNRNAKEAQRVKISAYTPWNIIHYVAVKNQKACSVGECDKDNGYACTANYDPLCCAEITYGNECMAKAAEYEDPRDCREGKCDHSMCTTEHRPLIHVWRSKPALNDQLRSIAVQVDARIKPVFVHGSMSHHVAMVKSLVMNA